MMGWRAVLGAELLLAAHSRISGRDGGASCLVSHPVPAS